MADKIKVMIRDEQKTVRVPAGVRLLIRRCCHAVLQLEKFEGSAQISVCFTDNEGIRAMNRQFRNLDAETDVLSFPLGENGVYDRDPETGAFLLGDIVISVQKAMEQAESFGHSLEREIAFLTVHSMLHLLGYDHEEGKSEESEMFAKQEEILTLLGLTRD
ncbi:MAG: rRNA maturation RNase YbeY [Clostridia bacterium]|nr:rRNA maturation RNase YbeY [Clostridia bacterium]